MWELGRWAVRLTLVGALSLAAYAAYRGEEAAPPLRFDPDPLVLPAPLEEGRDYERALVIVNQGDEPVTILGMVEFCASACFAGQSLPTTIPARGRGSVTLHIQANGTGPIVEEVTFYTSCPAQPTIVAKIQGQIVESSGDDPQETAPTPE